jgi:hypothetical protein
VAGNHALLEINEVLPASRNLIGRIAAQKNRFLELRSLFL